MLFDDEYDPTQYSPVAKAERSPQVRRKMATKRTRTGQTIHDFWHLLRQLRTLTMNRTKLSGPGKPGFGTLSSPTLV